MNPPVVDVDLLSRCSVSLFARDAHFETWMTACLVGPDAVLTSPSIGAFGNLSIELEVGGESRTGQLEIADDAAGVALVRFAPPVPWDLPRVFSTRELTVPQGAGFRTLVSFGHERSVSLSGTVLGLTTRNGKPFYVGGEVVIPAVRDTGGIAGAPIVLDGRILGLISGGTITGRGEHLSTFLIAPFSALRGTRLAERLVALGLADRADDPESSADDATAPPAPRTPGCSRCCRPERNTRCRAPTRCAARCSSRACTSSSWSRPCSCIRAASRATRWVPWGSMSQPCAR